MHLFVTRPMRLVQLSLLCIVSACTASLRTQTASAIRERNVAAALVHYEALRIDDGPDEELLARVAASLLENEILHGSAEQARAAANALVSAGIANEASAQHIVRETTDREMRVRFLRVLAQRGDVDANAALDELGERPTNISNHPENSLQNTPPTEDAIARDLASDDPQILERAIRGAATLANRSNIAIPILRAFDRTANDATAVELAELICRFEMFFEGTVSKLTSIAETESVAGAHAAGLLVRYASRENVVRFLERDLHASDAAIRRVAAHALARDALHPDLARTALEDENAFVRISAAGGILAAESARE